MKVGLRRFRSVYFLGGFQLGEKCNRRTKWCFGGVLRLRKPDYEGFVVVYVVGVAFGGFVVGMWIVVVGGGRFFVGRFVNECFVGGFWSQFDGCE